MQEVKTLRIERAWLLPLGQKSTWPWKEKKEAAPLTTETGNIRGGGVRMKTKPWRTAPLLCTSSPKLLSQMKQILITLKRLFQKSVGLAHFKRLSPKRFPKINTPILLLSVFWFGPINPLWAHLPLSLFYYFIQTKKRFLFYFLFII